MRAAARCVAALLLLALAGCGGGRVAVEAAGPAALPPAPPSSAGAASAHPSPAASTAVPVGCSRRAVACVSTAHQVAWLQERGRLAFGPVPVSTGRPSQRTPRGTFHVVWKDAEHTSSTYGTDMAYAVFFAAGGIAFHAGPLDEASHGCVHLPRAAAREFFSALDHGARVEVF